MCYRWSKAGYISKNYKVSNKDNEQEKKGNTRVYALTQEWTTEDPNSGNFEDKIIFKEERL